MKIARPSRLICFLAISSGACSSTPPVPVKPLEVVSVKPLEVVPVKPVEKEETKEVVVTPPPEDPDSIYQMRQMHLLEWIEKAKRDCERTKSFDAWLPIREGFPPDEVELVRTRCFEAVEVGMRGEAWIREMSACAHRFARANGKGKHECHLARKQTPDLPPELFGRHLSECTASCARAGEEEIEEMKHQSEHVFCCDGSTSPDCTYGSIRRGCCSGHRGVCIGD